MWSPRLKPENGWQGPSLAKTSFGQRATNDSSACKHASIISSSAFCSRHTRVRACLLKVNKRQLPLMVERTASARAAPQSLVVWQACDRGVDLPNARLLIVSAFQTSRAFLLGQKYRRLVYSAVDSHLDVRAPKVIQDRRTGHLRVN